MSIIIQIYVLLVCSTTFSTTLGLSSLQVNQIKLMKLDIPNDLISHIEYYELYFSIN